MVGSSMVLVTFVLVVTVHSTGIFQITTALVNYVAELHGEEVEHWRDGFSRKQLKEISLYGH